MFLRTALLAALALPATVLAAGAHSHGKAELDISLEGEQLILALEAPLDTLVGFERAPKSASEEARIKKAADKLRAADKLFGFTPEAACSLQSVKLVSAVIAPALLGEKSAASPAAAAEAGHADLDGEFIFRCAKPAALKSVSVNLFDAFSLMQRIDARLASGKVQRAAKLSGTLRSISW